MPIPIKCQCGKALKVKDELAGKAVKCPGCGQAIRVGAAPGTKPAAKPAAAPAPVAPVAAAAPPAAGGMDELFDEAGFSKQVASVCPSCRVEMDATAVFCTKCGYNKETGETFESHKTAGVDIDHGTLALDKASADLDHAKRLQKEMLAKSGMPWWMLSLVLFGIISATTLAVIAVNQSRQVEESSFDAMKTFLVLMGVAFSVVSAGAIAKLVVHLIKKNAKKPVLVKTGVMAGIMLAVAITSFVLASNR